MSLNIYQRHHPVGCMCPPCQGRPEPAAMPAFNSYQDPMRTLTVGNAPVHITAEGVVTVETHDSKYGRTICEYTIDPAYGSDILEVSKCVAEAFPTLSGHELLVALNEALKPSAINKKWLERGIAALTDPDCAAEAEAFCAALPVKVKEV